MVISYSLIINHVQLYIKPPHNLFWTKYCLHSSQPRRIESLKTVPCNRIGTIYYCENENRLLIMTPGRRRVGCNYGILISNVINYIAKAAVWFASVPRRFHDATASGTIRVLSINAGKVQFQWKGTLLRSTYLRFWERRSIEYVKHWNLSYDWEQTLAEWVWHKLSNWKDFYSYFCREPSLKK